MRSIDPLGRLGVVAEHGDPPCLVSDPLRLVHEAQELDRRRGLRKATADHPGLTRQVAVAWPMLVLLAEVVADAVITGPGFVLAFLLRDGRSSEQNINPSPAKRRCQGRPPQSPFGHARRPTVTRGPRCGASPTFGDRRAPAEGDLVRMLEVGADREAAREAGHRHPVPLAERLGVLRQARSPLRWSWGWWARTTSEVSPFTRSISSAIFRSSGSIPSIGESAPPSTW